MRITGLFEGNREGIAGVKKKEYRNRKKSSWRGKEAEEVDR